MPKQATVKLDVVNLRKWLDSQSESREVLAARIGKTKKYFYGVIDRGSMPKVVFSLFCNTYGLNASDYIKKAKPKNEIATPVEPSEIQGYDMQISVFPKKVRVSISFQQQEIFYAWSIIKGTDELDLIQAISYAAHMIYKKCEQKKLGGNDYE